MYANDVSSFVLLNLNLSSQLVVWLVNTYIGNSCKNVFSLQLSYVVMAVLMGLAMKILYNNCGFSIACVRKLEQ